MGEIQIENILSKLRAGEKDIIKKLFTQYYPMLCRSIFRFVKSKDTAEDLAQEVFIKFWEKRHSLQINSSIEAYLRRMAMNQAISYLRQNKKHITEEIEHVKLDSHDSNGESQIIQKELGASIQNAISSLPPRCKLIFELSRYEELTYKEIAKKLDISIKTVENQMGKALKILRNKLKGELGN